MKTCGKCGCVYDDSFNECPTCHNSITKNNTKKCSTCHNTIPINSDLCPYCGHYTKLTKGQIFSILGFICITLSFFGKFIFIIPGIILIIISLKYIIPDATKTLELNEKYPQNNHLTQDFKLSNTISSKTPWDDEKIKNYYLINAQNDDRRINRAKYETFSFKNLNTENKSADILNQEKTKVYHTTLTSCTCPDFKERNVPCKHMYRLANELGYFSLYKEEERELIEKLWSIKDNHKLLTTLVDVFYRIRDKKDKYYVKTSPSLNKLAEFNLIKFKEIPEQELVNIKYNTNELKGILHDKNFKKSITKKELIELFLSDKKLIKKLPKNMVHVTLTCTEKQKEYFTQTLNYFLYN